MKTEHSTTDSPIIWVLRLPQVMERVGLSRSSIYSLMSQGKFPRQVKVSANTAAWLEHEIDQYLADRIAEREEENPPW